MNDKTESRYMAIVFEDIESISKTRSSLSRIGRKQILCSPTLEPCTGCQFESR